MQRFSAAHGASELVATSPPSLSWRRGREDYRRFRGQGADGGDDSQRCPWMPTHTRATVSRCPWETRTSRSCSSSGCLRIGSDKFTVTRPARRSRGLPPVVAASFPRRCRVKAPQKFRSPLTVCRTAASGIPGLMASPVLCLCLHEAEPLRTPSVQRPTNDLRGPSSNPICVHLAVLF